MNGTQIHQGLSQPASTDSEIRNDWFFYSFFVRITDYVDWKIARIFYMYPVYLRIAGITPIPKGCAANATTNLLSVKNGKLRNGRNVGFPARSFCTLQGGIAG